MEKCHWCQADTQLYVNNVPICLKCAADFEKMESTKERSRTDDTNRELHWLQQGAHAEK
jgi:hypothetical protein